MKIVIRTGGQDWAINDIPEAPERGDRIRVDIGHGHNMFVVADRRWIIGDDGKLDYVEINCT
jgi:hypothetical protein